MGVYTSKLWNELTDVGSFPDNFKPEIFDPQLGFDGKRKLRDPLVTEDQINATLIRLNRRDYCVKYLMDRQKCLKDNAPFFPRCKEQSERYTQCLYEDAVMRMMEYERERRLIERAKRKRRLSDE